MNPRPKSIARRITLITLASAAFGCGSDKTVSPPGISETLNVLGEGIVAERYTAEIYVRGNYAYTTTWGFRDAPGNAVKIWDVSGNTPALVDSVIVPGASTLGDIQTSDDGQLLIVATELSPGSIAAQRMGGAMTTLLMACTLAPPG